MGLRDDMEVLGRFIDAGLGREFMQGTITDEQRARVMGYTPAPSDRSVYATGYRQIIERGD